MEYNRTEHPNLRIARMSPIEIVEELNTWNREEKIAWLIWNDRHGIYTDEDAIHEYGRILSESEITAIIIRQIDNARSV